METSRRADTVSAWAVALGAGLISLQLTWLIANRVATAIWDVPTGPTVGIVSAVIVGMAVTSLTGRRLSRSIRIETANNN